MTSIERRDFYRTEDRVHLIKTPIEKHLLSDNPYDDQFNIPRQALLNSQIQIIDNECRDLLRQVNDQNRALGSYLRAMNDKIDLLAKHMIRFDDNMNHRETVTLSEGGLSFYHHSLLEPESYLHCVMVLFPSYGTLACISQVKTCDQVADDPGIYRIGTEFVTLLESDRKQIVRHLRRLQSQERQGKKPLL